MRNRLKKDAIADCKDWHKRQQKGGRRPVKKRKPKKQTGSGKQTGAGKKQTGKKSKQTGGCIKPIRRQTGGSSWANDIMSDVM